MLPGWPEEAGRARRAAGGDVQPEEEAGAEDLGSQGELVTRWGSGDTGKSSFVLQQAGKARLSPGARRGASSSRDREASMREAPSWLEPAILLGPAWRKRKGPRVGGFCARGPSAKSVQGN